MLIGLASHAGPDGRNAFPAVATLVDYTRLSERTVQHALCALEELGLIRGSDPAIAAAYITRANRRPRGWNLALDRRPLDATAESVDTPQPVGNPG